MSNIIRFDLEQTEYMQQIVKVAYEDGYEQCKKDTAKHFEKIMALDIADCSNCPLDCEINTYSGCHAALVKYVLEQIGDNEYDKNYQESNKNNRC